jgi:hypothetical protein
MPRGLTRLTQLETLAIVVDDRTADRNSLALQLLPFWQTAPLLTLNGKRLVGCD